MKPVVFFDADERLRDFVARHPVAGHAPVFIAQDINAVPNAALKQYAHADIISLFTHSDKISNKKLDRLPRLKMINTRSTGFNHIDLAYCKKRGIVVANVPKYGEITVAEFAFALLLSVMRHVVQARNDMAQNQIRLDRYMGTDLAGKTIGIIGTGSIGRHMIQIAKGFGMIVAAYDPYPDPALKDMYVPSLKKLYQRSDIISLHIPSTPENRHLIGKQAFAEMKPGVVIINTARGDLIDTQALYQAVRAGHVGGAGLDVLENEDFLLNDDIDPNHARCNHACLLDSAMNLKLMQFKNVIVTPHIAFNSVDAIERIMTISVEDINRFIARKSVNRVA